jgi:hypothetical protein
MVSMTTTTKIKNEYRFKGPVMTKVYLAIFINTKKFVMGIVNRNG